MSVTVSATVAAGQIGRLRMKVDEGGDEAKVEEAEKLHSEKKVKGTVHSHHVWLEGQMIGSRPT